MPLLTAKMSPRQRTDNGPRDKLDMNVCVLCVVKDTVGQVVIRVHGGVEREERERTSILSLVLSSLLSGMEGASFGNKLCNHKQQQTVSNDTMACAHGCKLGECIMETHDDLT
ncbi:unnamed protein product [Brugia pahangi]|uniref:Uncharacterized protein n=1 Tax=Brugia pahangi TaxID=6280 RepID=A0A158PQZ1_BRUPA|nr:unnamed protein product [Brugia pahangi]